MANQEQKKVDITGKEITCRILTSTGDEILLSKLLTLTLPVTGIATLLLNAAELEGITAQRCYYSLEIPEGSFNFPVFVDHNAGGRGVMNIVDSVMPGFVPSYTVNIPANQMIPNNTANITSPAMIYSADVISSSGAVTTIQTKLDGYYGNVTLYGSTSPGTGWYSINNYVYMDTITIGNVIAPITTTGTKGYSITGYHPYIRMEFVSNCGTASGILTR